MGYERKLLPLLVQKAASAIADRKAFLGPRPKITTRFGCHTHVNILLEGLPSNPNIFSSNLDKVEIQLGKKLGDILPQFPRGAVTDLPLDYNVCQKYLERPYSFENFLPPSCFQGVNENVNPLPPSNIVKSVARALAILKSITYPNRPNHMPIKHFFELVDHRKCAKIFGRHFTFTSLLLHLLIFSCFLLRLTQIEFNFSGSQGQW